MGDLPSGPSEGSRELDHLGSAVLDCHWNVSSHGKWHVSQQGTAWTVLPTRACLAVEFNFLGGMG